MTRLANLTRRTHDGQPSVHDFARDMGRLHRTHADIVETLVTDLRNLEVQEAAQNPRHQNVVATVDQVRDALVAIDRARKARLHTITRLGGAVMLGSCAAAGATAWSGASLGIVVGVGVAPLVLFAVAATIKQQGWRSEGDSIDDLASISSTVVDQAEFYSAPALQAWRSLLIEFFHQGHLIPELHAPYLYTLEIVETRLAEIEDFRRAGAEYAAAYLTPAVLQGAVRND